MTTQKPLRPNNNEKTRLLRSCGALYSKPEAVQDEAFAHNEFFDPRDAVQVKYEMVRRHHIDARPVTEVAKSFGVSRQTFYKTVSVFKIQGIPGLLPQRRGPKQPHKCTGEILDFAARWSVLSVAERKDDLVKAIQRQFGVTLHLRSIDRALAKRKKKRQRRQERRA
jgi:transposase